MKKEFMVFFIIFLLLIYIPSSNFSKSSSPSCSEKMVTFYIQNTTMSENINNLTTTYIFNTNQGTRGTVDHATHYIIEDWYLYPLIAGNFYIFNGTFWIYIRFNGTDNNPNIYLTLYERSPSGQETQIAAGSSHPILATSIESYQISFNTTGVKIPAGYSIHLHFDLSGGTSTNYWVYYGNSTYASGFDVITNTSMYISDVETLNYQNVPSKGFGINATNKEITFLAFINDPLGGYDIKNVSIYLNGNSYNMIKISGTEDSFTNVYEFQINYTGWQTGNYSYTVYALDNSGYYYHLNYFSYSCYLRSDQSYFWIGFPLKINVNLYTSSGVPVSHARVELTNNRTVYGNFTENGKTVIYAYAGTYEIKIIYDNYTLPEVMTVFMNNKTYGNMISISNSTNMTIYSDIGNSTIKILTSSGMPVFNALVYMKYPNGITSIFQTGENGTLNLRNIGGGIYMFTVYYEGVVVYNSTVNFEFRMNLSSNSINLFTEIYDVKIIAGSYADENLSNAMIFLKNVYGSENINVTNSSGIAAFEIPSGNYVYTVEYMNTIVSSGNFTLSGNSTVFIKTDVFRVNMEIVDSLNNTLNGSFVNINGDGNTFTRISNGTMSYILPEGNYSVNVYWDNRNVNSTEIYVYGNKNITLQASVYYLTINVFDSNNNPLNGSYILIQNNQSVQGFSYKPEDTFRLPGGFYRIYVVYKGTYYLTGIDLVKEYNITLDHNYLINVKMPFPIPFYETYLFIMIIIFIVLAFLVYMIARKIEKGKVSK
ncbi:MAG: hypothetical protein ACP5RZ_02845 [Thermoplasmata archaeon]